MSSDAPVAAAASSSSPPTSSSNPSSIATLTMLPLTVAPPPANPRIENGHVIERIDKPFVYGTAAFWQGKNLTAEQQKHSHKWTVYLRGLENEDLSYFIESVAFTLHESFVPPIRVFTAAPYEVTETGWGQFEIGITINFKEVSGLDPIQLQHQLKLFPTPPQIQTTKRPVMSEVYDEFVFVNPTKEWWDVLYSGPKQKIEHHPLTEYYLTSDFAKDEDQAIAKLQAANETVQLQIDQHRARLFQVDQEVSSLTQRL